MALIHKDGKGMYERIDGAEAARLCYSYIKQNGDSQLADYWKLKRGNRYSNDKDAVYLNDCIELNEPTDTQEAVYAAFQNGLLKITQGGYEMDSSFGGYDIDRKARSMNREFVYDGTEGEFEKFIKHACGELENDAEWQKRFEAVKCCIGYLVSRHKEAVNYFVLATEADDTGNNGGTGKSLIGVAIGHWRYRYGHDCKREGADGRFGLSGMPDGTEIIQWDDLKEDFQREKLFSATTDGLEYEKKNKDTIKMSLEDSPKMYGTTNKFLKGDDSSNRRRTRFIELSNHYNDNLTAETEFGHRFFSEWNMEEWHRFDTFVMKCVQGYLSAGSFAGYQSENIADKAYRRNVPESLRDWFEDTADGIFSTTQVALTHYDLSKDYKDWYFDKYSHYPTIEFKRDTIGMHLKQSAGRFGFKAENKVHRVGGGTKRGWTLEKI